MTNRTLKMKTALCAIAAVVSGALVPTLASAQTYSPRPAYATYDSTGTYYDPCARSTTNRSTGGGLAGAGIGAAIGSGISGNGARTEGAVLGGLLGAVIGSSIGKKSAACTPGAMPPPPPPPPPPQAANDGPGYDDPTYAESRYEDARREAERDAYRRDSYRVTERAPDTNGCTLAESPIYLPDGRVQKRFVRVCPDAAGRYQVVD